HADYFLDLAEEAEPQLQTAQAAEWLNRLEDDNDNLRTSLQWGLDHDIETAARLAVALRYFWIIHSNITEGRKWFESVLERSDEEFLAKHSKILNGVGTLALFQGDYATAQNIYEKDLAQGKASGDKQQIAWANRGLGF